MSQECITQYSVGRACQHRGLHDGNQLARLRTECCEAQDAIAMRVDQCLEETARLGDRSRPQDRCHGNPGNAIINADLPRLRFIQPDPPELRVNEHTVRDQAVARTSIAAVPVVPHDLKVVEADVCELGAPSAIAHRPYAVRSSLEPFVDANVATRIEFDASCVESDPTSIRLTAGCHQNVSGIDGTRTGRGAHAHADPLAGAALHAQDLCFENYFDAFVLE